jgi:hypothetical protein
MLRVFMAAATEFWSYGLKSSEKVTPVVPSAISTLPPDDEAVVDEDSQAATSKVATPSTDKSRQFIDLSPP